MTRISSRARSWRTAPKTVWGLNRVRSMARGRAGSMCFPCRNFFSFCPPPPPQRKGRDRNRISKKKKQADKQSVPVMRACVHMQARATALVTEGTHVTWAGSGGGTGPTKRNCSSEREGAEGKESSGNLGFPPVGRSWFSAFWILVPADGRTDGALFGYYFFLNLATILFLFVFNSYYLIID